MRGETEANRETDANESVGSTGQCPVRVENLPTYEDMVVLEKELFGEEQKVDESVPLEWGTFKADNYLVRTLKQTAGLFAFAVKKEAEDTMKKVEQARKVFYGK